MNISSFSTNPAQLNTFSENHQKTQAGLNGLKAAVQDGEQPLREAFDQFVGEAFYGQMLSAMRKTVGKPAYFHGGRAEEMFQGQLDQVMSEKLTEATAHQFTGPMFELFQLSRK